MSYDVSPLAPELETKIENRSLKRGKEVLSPPYLNLRDKG